MDVVLSKDPTADDARKPFKDDEVLSRENEGGGCGGGAARSVDAMRSGELLRTADEVQSARQRVGRCDLPLV
jgi:hypothetical protein